MLEIFIKNEIGTWVLSQFSCKSSKHPFNNQVKLVSSFKSENQLCVFRKEDKAFFKRSSESPTTSYLLSELLHDAGVVGMWFDGRKFVLFLTQLKSPYSEP